MWEPPAADVELPPGEDPLVLVAPSTSQDPEHRLLHAALCGLADAPVVCSRPGTAPALTSATRAGEHATRRVDLLCPHDAPLRRRRLPRRSRDGRTSALFGCAVVACPVAGDMNENAARVDWAGAGVRVPRRFISPRPLRLAVERGDAGSLDPGAGAGTGGLVGSHDAAATAATLIESVAKRSSSGIATGSCA